MKPQVFGRWTVVALLPPAKKNVFVMCECECGTKRRVMLYHLRKGQSRSCGCLFLQMMRSRTPHNKSHGVTGTSEYQAFYNAQRRCRNPRDRKFKIYGGRGVKFKFANFQEFFDAIGKKPTPEHVLDRTNTDSHYEKGNVRWVTSSQSAFNRRPRKRRT